MGGKPPVGGAPPTYRGRTQLGTQDVVVRDLVQELQEEMPGGAGTPPVSVIRYLFPPCYVDR
jgi:hypothetical protein